MRRDRERAPTRSKRARGLKALLVGMLAVPTAIVLTAGTAAASEGGNGGNGVAAGGGAGITATTPNVAECPGGGLKLDGINDRLIPNGTYSAGGLTIVISNSTYDETTKVLSFTWTATTVPAGKVVSGVVVKAGNETPGTFTGGTTGTVTWQTPPWYSHVSFCLGNVQTAVCPGTNTPITNVTDANGDQIADMCQSFCPGGTTTLITNTTDANGDQIADMCQSFCPGGTTTLITNTTDANGNGTPDMCESSGNPGGVITVITPVPPVLPEEEEEEPEEEPAVVLPEEEEVIAQPAVVETPAPVIEAAPAVALPAQVEPAPAAQLPRTGGSTTGMLLQLAIGLIGMGLLLTRTSRRRTNS